MVESSEIVSRIYNQIQDKQSKLIYISRLNYSLTHDGSFLQNMVNQTLRSRMEWIDFISYLKDLSGKEKLIIFGAGIWGNILYGETNTFVDWKYVIDSNPQNKKVGNLPIIDFDVFAREYNNEYVAISSYKNYKSMKKQLLESGIPNEKIIDAGSIIFQLTEKAIYFDLKELLPINDYEIFVDAGCFDGLTTKQFTKWCGGKGYSYCFEPDERNIEVIQRNLNDYHNYEIINKALYSHKAELAMNAKGNFASSVSELKDGLDVPIIEAVALDDILRDKKVTFIKMDIEGSELSALHGAENIIREQKPRLAISIYHKLEDIWAIPKLILEFNPEYRFYLRHYSFSNYDTVLYAI